MELFAKLFDSLLVFVYHCFDRVVIHGYLSGLSRPEQVVYFFRQVLAIPVQPAEQSPHGAIDDRFDAPVEILGHAGVPAAEPGQDLVIAAARPALWPSCVRAVDDAEPRRVGTSGNHGTTD